MYPPLCPLLKISIAFLPFFLYFLGIELVKWSLDHCSLSKKKQSDSILSSSSQLDTSQPDARLVNVQFTKLKSLVNSQISIPVLEFISVWEGRFFFFLLFLSESINLIIMSSHSWSKQYLQHFNYCSIENTQGSMYSLHLFHPFSFSSSQSSNKPDGSETVCCKQYIPFRSPQWGVYSGLALCRAQQKLILLDRLVWAAEPVLERKSHNESRFPCQCGWLFSSLFLI